MREQKGKENKKENLPCRLPEVVASYVLLLKLCQCNKKNKKEKKKPNPVTHKSSRGIQICEGQEGQSWRVVCDKSNAKPPLNGAAP